MQIRHTRPEDLPAMQEIFADARAFMRENGNPDQWGDRFPTREMLDKDLALHRSYVCEDNGKIAATFAFTTDGEPTYRVIRGGAWLDDAPYGVVHRIAAAKGTHGAASFCMNWCMEQCGNIRIDTRRTSGVPETSRKVSKKQQTAYRREAPGVPFFYFRTLIKLKIDFNII